MRTALLIAVGTYEDSKFHQLRSPATDVSTLAGVLGDPQIGQFSVDLMQDPAAHEATRGVETFFANRSRDDVLLVYLSCHGLKDEDGDLYFAMTNTTKNLIASTALPASFVRTRMARCRAGSIVVILDCCYSGAFMPGFKGDTDIHMKDELAGSGRMILTATSRTEYAWEGDRLHTLDTTPSRFTGAIVDGLRSGEADLNGDGVITAEELYSYTYEKLLKANTRQTPRYWAEVDRHVWIARANKRPPRTPAQGAHIEFEAMLKTSDLISGAVVPFRITTPDGRQRTINIRFPRGSLPGRRIRVSGQGQPGTPPGDLYVRVTQQDADTYRIVGYDIHCDVPVSQAVLTKGGVVTVGGPQGPVSLRLPAGTPLGRSFRIRGRGIPHGPGDQLGDLIARVVAPT